LVRLIDIRDTPAQDARQNRCKEVEDTGRELEEGGEDEDGDGEEGGYESEIKRDGKKGRRMTITIPLFLLLFPLLPCCFHEHLIPHRTPLRSPHLSIFDPSLPAPESKRATDKRGLAGEERNGRAGDSAS
jgi:hypothetical protein